MNKVILGVSILAIGIGTYFYLSGTEEVKIVKKKVSKKIELSENMVGKQKNLKKKEIEDKSEIVKGYKLPPEPDKTLNDSTLLGIDSNNNMLRDDVERWIVKQPWSHQRISASFQKARGYQILLNSDMGDYVRKSTLKNMAGDAYQAILERDLHRKLSLKEKLENNNLFSKKVFNTKERKEEIKKYNRSFSGTIIHSFPSAEEDAYKYADYTMEDGTLNSYEFIGEDRYYSNNKIPLYGDKKLITSYWSLEKNKNIGIGGDFNDKFCEINFGIKKQGLECSNAYRKYIKDLENGLIK